jgi:hypothetical protein
MMNIRDLLTFKNVSDALQWWKCFDVSDKHTTFILKEENWGCMFVWNILNHPSLYSVTSQENNPKKLHLVYCKTLKSYDIKMDHKEMYFQGKDYIYVTKDVIH